MSDSPVLWTTVALIAFVLLLVLWFAEQYFCLSGLRTETEILQHHMNALPVYREPEGNPPPIEIEAPPPTYSVSIDNLSKRLTESIDNLLERPNQDENTTANFRQEHIPVEVKTDQ